MSSKFIRIPHKIQLGPLSREDFVLHAKTLKELRDAALDGFKQFIGNNVSSITDLKVGDEVLMEIGDENLWENVKIVGLCISELDPYFIFMVETESSEVFFFTDEELKNRKAIARKKPDDE